MCHLKVWWVGINDWSCYHQEESSSSPKRWQTCLSTKLHGMTCKKTANLLAININILVGLVVMSRRPCTGLDGVITRKTTSHRSSGCHDTPVPSTGQGPDAVPPSGRSAWRDSVMWQLQPFAPVTTYRGMYRIWERQFPHMPPPPPSYGTNIQLDRHKTLVPCGVHSHGICGARRRTQTTCHQADTHTTADSNLSRTFQPTCPAGHQMGRVRQAALRRVC